MAPAVLLFLRSVNLLVPKLTFSIAYPSPLKKLTATPNVMQSLSRESESRVADSWRKSSSLQLLNYDLFDVFNVPPHSSLRSFGIVALDGSQDPAVAGERLLRAPFQL